MKKAILFLLMSLMLTGAAHAAVFAKYDGIDGESKDENHDKWIDVLSIDWGAHKPGGGATGQSRRRGATVVEDVTLTIEYEKASVKLLEAVYEANLVDDTNAFRAGRKKIASTCPTIPGPYTKVKFGIQNDVENGRPIPNNKISITANGRKTVSEDSFKQWYEKAKEWSLKRDVVASMPSGLEGEIVTYAAGLEKPDSTSEKVLDIARTTVGLVNFIFKSQPPSWKKGMIDRVQAEIKDELTAGTLDLYNRLAMGRFTKFLKEHGIAHDDVYVGVADFVENYGIEALTPFIKYDRALTSGNDAGIDYTPSYIMDLTIKPKAQQVVYREENGLKAKFSDDFTFETNFGVDTDVNGFTELASTIDDVFRFIETRFVSPDEGLSRAYETRLWLHAYMSVMNNLADKGQDEILKMGFKSHDYNQYLKMQAVFDQSIEMLAQEIRK